MDMETIAYAVSTTASTINSYVVSPIASTVVNNVPNPLSFLWSTTDNRLDFAGKNDFEVVIRVSKELEYVLETHFLSTGKGLHEKITNADDLPEGLVRKMRFLATIRNKLIHDRDFNAIPDRPGFIFAFHESLRGLQAIIKSRQPAEEQDAAGDQYCVIC